MHIIKEVLKDSIAEEVEIEAGDALLSVNGQKIEDIIDYIFLLEESYVELEIQKKSGEIWIAEIDKEPEEELGIIFENPIIDEAKRCQNNCVFCFIDQLPKGMRETLYFKDDDSRLSFLQGNFVTLTNMSEAKLERIVRYRISPINVSVHTTDPELRVKMLGNRFAGKIMQQLKYLTEHGIVVNAQVVLCPGYNDGEKLVQTIRDLEKLGEHLNSVAVVPIGLSNHRQGLTSMRGFTSEESANVVKTVAAIQTEMLESRGSRFVFLADEFYILSGCPLPPYEAYEGFLQYEDGVGMLRKLMDEVHDFIDLHGRERASAYQRNVVIVTGTAAGPFIKALANELMTLYKGIQIRVVSVINEFFGERITVSGLVTGKDIMAQVDVHQETDAVLLPINMLRSGETVLLDDITVEMLEAHFNKPVRIVDISGRDFVDAIINGGNHE
jgi:putative radical SAM enzyme (TIGR03279 family)